MSGSFDTVKFLKNEIDKRVVFLSGENDQGEPAETKTERGLWQRHLLGPIPGLFAGPDHERRDPDREQVIRFVKNPAQQRRPRLRVTEPKHAREIGESARQIGRAEENPAEQDDEKRERDPEWPRKIMIETFTALAALEREHAAVKSAPDHEIPRRAVPQSAEEHREDQVDVGAASATTIAAERDVEVF